MDEDTDIDDIFKKKCWQMNVEHSTLQSLFKVLWSLL